MIDRDAMARDERIIHYTINKNRNLCSMLPSDELLEAAHYGFAKAVMSWNDTERSFPYWAYCKIRQEIIEAVRQQNRHHGKDRNGDPHYPKCRSTIKKAYVRRASCLDVNAIRKGCMMAR